MKMKFRTLLVSTLFLLAMTLSAQTREYTFNNTAMKEGLTVESNTRSSIQMRHALKQLSIVNISDNGYTGDVVEGGMGISLPTDAGAPNLPAFSRFVAIPNGATAHIEMGYRSMTTLQNVDLLPAAPIKYETDDSPNTYEKDLSIYNRNAFFPEQPVMVSVPFSLRGVQTVAVTVTPYQYNPITKELRMYDDLQFDVRFDGGNGEFGDSRLRSPYWDPILMQNLANYNQLPIVDYEARMQQWVTTRPTGCEYLIVIPNNESFRSYANQLAEYRIKQGILTEVKSLNDMGCTSTTQMKTYFHDAYNNWDIPPVAVLLLGDHNNNMSVGIPAEYTWHSQDYGNCITDNGYADVNGDNMPEMAFSRLVAANANEAQMMVSKQIEYEFTNPNMNASSYDQPITALGWQTQRWFQICSEAVGGYWRQHGKHPVRINAIYSGTPGNSWSSNQNTYMVVNYFGPNGTSYIPATPAELGGWTGGTGTQVVQAVNNGCMLLQHRDHGYYQGWGEPDFSNSHVAQMNNVGKMTFVNTINCQTGTFDHTPECLIEAFMRRTSNGQNAGAVGCIGPTQTSYSFVNDAYAWGMYDQYDPQFLPDYGPYADYEGNWRPAFGNVAGKYFLQQSSWPYNFDNKAITYKMFTAHCDAFLTLYTQVPTSMNVNHPTQIASATTSINVSAPQGAVIALTRNNNILAVATATGYTQSITFQAQPSNTDITIVATKQDRLRYVGNIHVISEPNLIVTEVTVNDGNNAQLEYGEQASFDIVIKNNGNLASAVATGTLTTRTHTFVTIDENTVTIPALSPNQTTNLDHVFHVSVSDSVPNATPLQFTLTMNDGGHTWTSDFSFNAYAPNLKVYENMTINDLEVNKGNGNGRLDPGETAEIMFTYANIGGSTANNVTATLSTTQQQYITIGSPIITTPLVNPNETINVTYIVNVSPDMPRGEDAHLTLTATAGVYSNSFTFTHRVGLASENFENGIGDLEWENDPNHPWVITTNDPHSGQYCLQSGTIGLNATSTLNLTLTVENETDEIRFFRKTDCHENDYLKFYIDGTEITNWSGNSHWREMVIPVTQGEHLFTWAYVKDGSGTSGQDHVWIDDILLPVHHIPFSCNAGADQNICQVAAQLGGNVNGAASLAWTTSGDGNFNQSDIINPIYTPGEQDLANKSVVLTLTVTNEEGSTLSDNVIIHFHEAASIVMDGEADICESEVFQANAIVNEAGSVTWSTDGDGSFDRPDNVDANYTPGEQDKANGQVTLTLTALSEYGCGDASHDLVLTIHALPHTEFEMNSCGPYTWNGNIYEEAGDYEQTLESIYGCDSIVVMHLAMVDAYNVEVEQNACENYEWGGMLLYESGIYEHTFTSINGCDSTVAMYLTIFAPSIIYTDIEACDNYYLNGINCTETGVYEYILTDLMGCDSIVRIDLTIIHTPEILSIAGETVIDANQNPTNTYTINGEVREALVQFSINPEEAGIIATNDNIATITWNAAFSGIASIKANAINNCGETNAELAVSVVTSVNEYDTEAKIYPNPTKDIITIEVKDMRHIVVYNLFGQKVYEIETEGNSAKINMAAFGTGTYLVHIRTDQGDIQQRINLIR